MPIAIADIVIAAVIILMVVVGAKSGLLQSLAGLIVLVCSAVGASFAARLLADPLAARLEPLLSDVLSAKLHSGNGNSLAPAAASAGDMLEKFGFTGKALEDLANQVMQTVKETGRSVADSVVGTVTHSIAYAAVFLVAFIALLVVLTLVVKTMELATKLPGLKTVNAVGGGALGLIKGVLLVFFLVWILRRLQLIITPEMVEHSVILSFFANNSPFSLLTGL